MSEQVWGEIVDAIVEVLGSRGQCAMLDQDMHIWDVSRVGTSILAVCHEKGAALRIDEAD